MEHPHRDGDMVQPAEGVGEGARNFNSNGTFESSLFFDSEGPVEEALGKRGILSLGLQEEQRSRVQDVG